MNNPYATPDAVLSAPLAGVTTYQPKFFSIHGRIGRLRYLAYLSLSGFILSGLAGILIAVLLPTMLGGEGSMVTVAIVLGLINIPAFVLTFIIAKRRLNDLDRSGWWSLIFFVPILNVIAALYLVFGSGTEGHNRFGPPPAKNSALLVIGGLVLPIVFGVGILAAVAIPAYQEYTQRAQIADAMQE